MLHSTPFLVIVVVAATVKADNKIPQSLLNIVNARTFN